MEEHNEKWMWPSHPVSTTISYCILTHLVPCKTKRNGHPWVVKKRWKWVLDCTHSALFLPPVPLLCVANQTTTLSFSIPLLNPCKPIFQNQRISPCLRLRNAAELKKWRPIKGIYELYRWSSQNWPTIASENGIWCARMEFPSWASFWRQELTEIRKSAWRGHGWCPIFFFAYAISGKSLETSMPNSSHFQWTCGSREFEW